MNHRTPSKHWMRWFAERSEALMFSSGLAFLVGAAVLKVLWVDIPLLQERAAEMIANDRVQVAELLFDSSGSIQLFVVLVMLCIWAIVLVEAVVHLTSRGWDKPTRKYHWFSLAICLCPALRMCARSPEMKGRIWLPGLGWRKTGPSLQRQMERKFSVPMMVVALLILPILIVEFFMKDQVASYAWLRWLLHIGTGVIWFAFAAEFILMVSIAEKKIDYCKQHWVDLAIILLPLISFLRTLSIVRAARLSNLMRVQQLTKFARVYRLRGTMLKAFRVLVLFNLTERLMWMSDERRIAKLEKELADVEKQARLLRQKITKLRLKSQAEQEKEAEGVA